MSAVFIFSSTFIIFKKGVQKTNFFLIDKARTFFPQIVKEKSKLCYLHLYDVTNEKCEFYIENLFALTSSLSNFFSFITPLFNYFCLELL